MDEVKLRTEDIWLSFGGLNALKGVSFDIKEGEILAIIQEEVQGFITTEKKGKSGFGYDPIFFYPPLQKTFAELSPEEKNEVSHRGRALKRLRTYLEDYTQQQTKT